MSIGIAGYGVYLPWYRIKREDIAKAWASGGRGENSVAYHDEDVITMATEASLNALHHSGIDGSSELGAIYLGTDSGSHVEHSSLGIIGEVLRAKEEIDVADFTASPRASFAAFKACADAVKSKRISYGLVIGSEARSVAPGSPEEINCGDGAAALLLGSEGTIADVEEIYTYSSYIADRWRHINTPHLQEYEPRFTRDYGYHRHILKAANGLLDKLGAHISDFHHVVLQQADLRMTRACAKALKMDAKQTQAGDLFGLTGELGAASVFMGLASVLDNANPGENVLAISYGSGVSDAVALRINERILDRRETTRTVESYLKSKTYVDGYLSFAKMKGALERSTSPTKIGLSPASAALWRDGRDIRQLSGAKCVKCGYVNYPPSIRKICIRCGDTHFENVVLSRKGKVHTYCISLYVPAPLKSPLPIVIADLDDGNRYRALGTEIRGDEDIKIDMPVELVLRNILTEDGLGIYGNVFRPLRES